MFLGFPLYTASEDPYQYAGLVKSMTASRFGFSWMLSAATSQRLAISPGIIASNCTICHETFSMPRSLVTSRKIRTSRPSISLVFVSWYVNG